MAISSWLQVFKSQLELSIISNEHETEMSFFLNYYSVND